MNVPSGFAHRRNVSDVAPDNSTARPSDLAAIAELTPSGRLPDSVAPVGDTAGAAAATGTETTTAGAATSATLTTTTATRRDKAPT